MVGTRGWGEGSRELLFNWDRALLWEDEKVPEMDTDSLHMV